MFEDYTEIIIATTVAGVTAVGIFVFRTVNRFRQVQRSTRPHPPERAVNPAFAMDRRVALRPHEADITGPLQRSHPQGWQLSRAVLDQLIVSNPDSRDNMELGAVLLIDALERNSLLDQRNKYSSTFAQSMLDLGTRLTPQQAINVFRREYDQRGMSERAIYLLGGLFIIGVEAERAVTANQIHALAGARWGSDLMALGTIQDTSRFTWKLTMYSPFFGNIRALDLLRSAFAVLRSNRPHGRCADGAVQILMPTTVFGSSATIMKVMKKCEALGMTPEQCMSIAFAVAHHWLDKNISGKRDYHSLIEALHGALTYLGMDEGTANRLLAHQLRTLGPTVYRNPDNWILRTNTAI
jgi:hypothetical protein